MTSVFQRAARPLHKAAAQLRNDSGCKTLWLGALAVLVLMSAGIASLATISREWTDLRAARADIGRVRDELGQVQQLLSRLQVLEREVSDGARSGAVQAAGRETQNLLRQLDSQIRDPQARDLLARLAAITRRQLDLLDEAPRQPGARADPERLEALRSVGDALIARETALLGAPVQALAERSQRSEQLVWVILLGTMLLLLAAVAATVRHVRRRAAAEKAARGAFSLIRSALEAVEQGVALFDGRGRLLLWNPRFCELRGLDPSQLSEHMPVNEVFRLGARLSIRLYQDGEAQTESIDSWQLAEVMFARQDFLGEASRPDQTVLQICGRPMATGDYVVTYADVTALKRSESAYRDQAARLSAILDHAADAIVTINESGSIESWSKSAEHLFGYQADEILQRNVRFLMSEPQAAAHDGYIRRYLQTGEPRVLGRRREIEALHKDGRRFPIDLAISEMWIGPRRLFIGMMRDISARREIEQLKSTFVSAVSHELRTPLTSISGSLGLLAGGVAGALPSKAGRLIDIAKLNCERLVRLINDILDLEKAESGKLDFRLEPQRLKPIVQNAIDLNRSYAHHFGAVIELDPCGDDADVLVDRDRLIQVLTNILSNASKFSPGGGTIHVRIRKDGEVVRISVRDEGPGIPLDFHARVFERFAQADSSDSRPKSGTGLGLSICRSIVARLGGDIGFESPPGMGATFHVSLPIYAQAPTSSKAGSDDP